MRVTSLNHITLAVTDLDRSIAFYRDVLGFDLAADWPKGAYLEAGALWLCLECAAQVTLRQDDTHLAFGTPPEDFEGLAAQIAEHAPIWKENRSEGRSIYFSDPDGHKLELHDGNLGTRLTSYRKTLPDGMTLHPRGSG